MDYKEKLISLMDCISAQEKKFISDLKGQKPSFKRSYDNWGFMDVLSHCSCWRILAAEKLEKIAAGSVVDFHENLDSINRKFHDSTFTLPLEQIETLTEKSSLLLKDRLMRLDNVLLASKSRLKGFNNDLWCYVLVDGFVHPTVHMVFHYIKLQSFDTAFNLLQGNYLLLLEQSREPGIIAEYFSMGEIFEELDEMEDKEAILANLKTFIEKSTHQGTLTLSVTENFLKYNKL